VEVLKDRILEALRDDETLAPTQIGVLAPDISRYAPYIESVFPSRPPGKGAADHLNFNLTDLPSRSEAPYPSAFKALMDLPGSRFGRSSLVNLFSNPCFAPSARNPEAEESWRRIVETLHIRWGVDENHRQKEGAADTRTGAWETAFERLLAGYYHEEDDCTNLLPAKLQGDGDADTAGELMHVIRSLNRELRPLNAENLSLKKWTLKWEKIVERWLSPRRDGEDADDDHRDRLRIKGAVRDLLALDEDVNGLSDFSGDSIPWPAFSSLLEEFTSPSSGRRGRYLSRGVTCASLKPTRAIPFRRIYILGLDEGAWPNREFLTGFDLRDRVPKFIDLSRESVDRFALLEAIFSASDHLSLFYTGRDAERGDPLSPAAPIVELFEHLGEGAPNLIRRHPLNPFHPSTLGGKGQLATSSTDALALGEVLYRGLEKPTPESLPLLPPEDEESLDWQTLVKFLKNPVEYFYLQRLGAAREADEHDMGDDDVLEAEFLDWWSWRNSHIAEKPETILKPEKLVDDFRSRLGLEGSVSNTPAGELQAESWEENAAELAAALEELISNGLDIGEPFSCRFVPGLSPEAIAPAAGTVLNLPSPLISLMSEAGEENIHISGIIRGLRFSGKRDGENSEVWTFLDFISGKNLQGRHKLRSWAAALMIGASMGEQAPKELRVYRLCPNSKMKTLRRYFFKASDCPVNTEEEIVLLSNPSTILQSLVKTFRGGESSPLVLYPDLADKLAAAEKKEPIADNLAGAAADAWYGILNDSWSTSTLRDCYYRQHYLKSPDFSSDAFAEAWEKLYREGGIL
ncbi:MAG: exodeoxyribonuclease V subunit gamma, partial [Spirochaetaceae bacterium]|nr:exodeoxyribonuclease V subunit gamma [Spirochaetaceae bacterium]